MSSVPKTVMTEAAIAVPIGSPSAIAVPRSGLRLRAWVLTAMLFVLPLLAYWTATFHDYGLRDDYSNLREAHEELGKVVKFCASAARPIYGWLLQATFKQTSSVQNLEWMRFFAALLLGAMSLVSFRGLRTLGWSFNTSLCFAVLLALVPSAQVIAAWAIGWPYAATALLAIGGFFTVEGALAVGLRAGAGRAVGQWSVALGLMLVAALIYQPSAMFYVVPLRRSDREPQAHAQELRWMGIHLGFVVGTWDAYGVICRAVRERHLRQIRANCLRIALGRKIACFCRSPAECAQFVRAERQQSPPQVLYLGCRRGRCDLIAGAYLEWRRHGTTRGVTWLAGLLILPTFAFAVSMIASERYATYRTILAMTAVLLCFLVASFSALTARWSANARRMVVASVVSLAFFTAQHHSYALIAVPQGNEWQLIMAGAKHVRLESGRPRIFAIASTPADISTATIYHDEFGSISSNSEWVPREMFKRAMHDLHPEIANLDSRYDFATGPALLAGQPFDVIIDMHRLRQFYVNN